MCEADVGNTVPTLVGGVWLMKDRSLSMLSAGLGKDEAGSVANTNDLWNIFYVRIYDYQLACSIS